MESFSSNRNSSSGSHPGRIAPDEITVFDSSSIALQDLYVAHRLLPERETQLGAFELVHQPSRLVASPDMTVDDLLDINDAVDAAIVQGCDGVVITQGTDTVEEIAFGLDLLYCGPAPVVITAAIRNASMAGADGPANLLASVRVAASRTARDLGVLVVVNDEIVAVDTA